MKPPIPVAILVRVSTHKQETDRQFAELRAVAESKGWKVVEEFQEIISGTTEGGKRQGLEAALILAEAGKVRKLLVLEVSRLARRHSVAHAAVERLTEAGVSLYWHGQRIETLLPDGKMNPAAGIMFALLAEMARSEREVLVTRINSGLDAARRKGVRLGRPKGPERRREVLAKHRDVVRLLAEGTGIRAIARETGKSANTVAKVKALVARNS